MLLSVVTHSCCCGRSRLVVPLAFFDPQHRGILDKLKFGNESARQKGRAMLPAMTDEYIDACCRECARLSTASGYLMRWIDTFGLCEAHHHRIAECYKCVDLIAWDNLRSGVKGVGSTMIDHDPESRNPQRISKKSQNGA
jgi:hypothetical protein